ncbi:hypothetical protein BgiBS90_018137 [Biomphalaria glabrata]|nr:hypothetical protein BgiBS90_018137 [Biomphalaria glabrata]
MKGIEFSRFRISLPIPSSEIKRYASDSKHLNYDVVKLDQRSGLQVSSTSRYQFTSSDIEVGDPRINDHTTAYRFPVPFKVGNMTTSSWRTDKIV